MPVYIGSVLLSEDKWILPSGSLHTKNTNSRPESLHLPGQDFSDAGPYIA